MGFVAGGPVTWVMQAPCVFLGAAATGNSGAKFMHGVGSEDTIVWQSLCS